MIVKKLFQLFSGAFLFCGTAIYAQKADNIINLPEVSRIINVLASDEMGGRKNFSPSIDKAAAFIATEYKKAGIQTVKGDSYLQTFTMCSALPTGTSLVLDGATVDSLNAIVFTSHPQITITEKDKYRTVKIAKGASFFTEARNLIQGNENTIVWVDDSFKTNFNRISAFKRNFFKSATNVVFILQTTPATTFTIKALHNIREQSTANVVGMLPGTTHKDEYVIFSGHYDHMGIVKPNASGDSIMNGANDDASGITAVIMLANYYKALGNNKRTIIFASFACEEIGGFGSQYFSQQLNPAKVMAMFNIEMIGTDSKWGKNSAYITGYDKTDMGKILANNLQGSAFSFNPDPYPEQNLFYRSDNATLARLGVPAHTISTSKMDSEPNYHKVTDEVSTLDLENMTAIIRSIAISARSIVEGKDTPSRVNTDDLR